MRHAYEDSLLDVLQVKVSAQRIQRNVDGNCPYLVSRTQRSLRRNITNETPTSYKRATKVCVRKSSCEEHMETSRYIGNFQAGDNRCIKNLPGSNKLHREESGRVIKRKSVPRFCLNSLSSHCQASTKLDDLLVRNFYLCNLHHIT